jgi:hypothetical protein
VVRTALTGALRSGLLDRVIPDRIRITAPADRIDLVHSLQTEVAQRLGEPVVLSLGVGSARANRKPVLEAIAADGRPLAFVKLADDAVTRGLLTVEAGALRRLAGRAPEGLRVPRLIHHGHWHGVDLLVQSTLVTPPWPAHRRASRPYRAMRSLAAAFPTGRLGPAESPGWQRIVEDAGAIRDLARAEIFDRVREAVGVRLDGIELAHGAWHGDWTPWNMAWVRAEVRLWDWERFSDGVPVGLDPLHYTLAHYAGRIGWAQALTRIRDRAAEIVAPIGVSADEAEPVLLWYLLDLSRRYLLASGPAGGRPLRERTDVLLRFLATAAGESGCLPKNLPEWRNS